ncbi:MAG: hypothetical protein M1834_008179 [Cirrosporium novae-zelandiae]|nr:MAG: hypothetical protein M1834_008179 [Cirrosporium novae-zelandiae]
MASITAMSYPRVRPYHVDEWCGSRRQGICDEKDVIEPVDLLVARAFLANFRRNLAVMTLRGLKYLARIRQSQSINL